MVEEGPGVGGIQEGNLGGTVVRSEENIEENTASDGASNVAMGCAFGEIHQQNGSGALAVEMWSPVLWINVVWPARTIWRSISIARRIVHFWTSVYPGRIILVSITAAVGVGGVTSTTLLQAATALWIGACKTKTSPAILVGLRVRGGGQDVAPLDCRIVLAKELRSVSDCALNATGTSAAHTSTTPSPTPPRRRFLLRFSVSDISLRHLNSDGSRDSCKPLTIFPDNRP